MQNIKIFLFLSIGMFVIAVFLGILTGNKFGLIILRALLSSVVIGGLGFLLSYFIKQFVPNQEDQESNTDLHTQDLGSNIDVTLPEENPHLGNTVDAGLKPNNEEIPVDNNSSEISNENSVNNDQYKKEENNKSEADIAEPGEIGGENIDPANKMNNKPSTDQGIPETNAEPPKPDTNNNAKVIPDISDIVNSEEADELDYKNEKTNPANAEENSDFKTGSLENTNNSAIDENPSTLAKAIRTVIAKDNK